MIAISGFGVGMSAEMQALILLFVLMICCMLQYQFQPFEVLGITRKRHKILRGLEFSVLAMLIMTLWAGLVMFKLDESSEDPQSKSAHTFLTVITVLANVVFVFVLVFILLRQIYHEKEEDGTTKKLSRFASGNIAIRCIASLGRMKKRGHFTNDSVNGVGSGDVGIEIKTEENTDTTEVEMTSVSSVQKKKTKRNSLSLRQEEEILPPLPPRGMQHSINPALGIKDDDDELNT